MARDGAEARPMVKRYQTSAPAGDSKRIKLEEEASLKEKEPGAGDEEWPQAMAAAVDNWEEKKAKAGRAPLPKVKKRAQPGTDPSTSSSPPVLPLGTKAAPASRASSTGQAGPARSGSIGAPPAKALPERVVDLRNGPFPKPAWNSAHWPSGDRSEEAPKAPAVAKAKISKLAFRPALRQPQPPPDAEAERQSRPPASPMAAALARSVPPPPPPPARAGQQPLVPTPPKGPPPRSRLDAEASSQASRVTPPPLKKALPGHVIGGKLRERTETPLRAPVATDQARAPGSSPNATASRGRPAATPLCEAEETVRLRLEKNRHPTEDEERLNAFVTEYKLSDGAHLALKLLETQALRELLKDNMDRVFRMSGDRSFLVRRKVREVDPDAEGLVTALEKFEHAQRRAKAPLQKPQPDQEATRKARADGARMLARGLGKAAEEATKDASSSWPARSASWSASSASGARPVPPPREKLVSAGARDRSRSREGRAAPPPPPKAKEPATTPGVIIGQGVPKEKPPADSRSSAAPPRSPPQPVSTMRRLPRPPATPPPQKLMEAAAAQRSSTAAGAEAETAPRSTGSGSHPGRAQPVATGQDKEEAKAPPHVPGRSQAPWAKEEPKAQESKAPPQAPGRSQAPWAKEEPKAPPHVPGRSQVPWAKEEPKAPPQAPGRSQAPWGKEEPKAQPQPPGRLQVPRTPEPKAPPVQTPEPADEKDELSEFLREADPSGALMRYLPSLRTEFAGLEELGRAALSDQSGWSKNIISYVEPSFFEALGVQTLGHRLLLAKAMKQRFVQDG